MQVETSAERRERRVLSDTRRQSSAKQRGACPDSDWRTTHASLNMTHCRMDVHIGRARRYYHQHAVSQSTLTSHHSAKRRRLLMVVLVLVLVV